MASYRIPYQHPPLHCYWPVLLLHLRLGQPVGSRNIMRSGWTSFTTEFRGCCTVTAIRAGTMLSHCVLLGHGSGRARQHHLGSSTGFSSQHSIQTLQICGVSESGIFCRSVYLCDLRVNLADETRPLLSRTAYSISLLKLCPIYPPPWSQLANLFTSFSRHSTTCLAFLASCPGR